MRKKNPKLSRALRKHHRCIKRTVIKGVLRELHDYEFVTEVRKLGITSQLLYEYRDRARCEHVCVYKRITTIKVISIQGGKEFVEKKLRRMHVRETRRGWNVGSKIFIIVR